jgi:hypothetical protein
MSLWRKRMSIKSDDLSIKSSKGIEMSIEAMKQALEALEYLLNTSHEGFDVDMAELLAHRAITSLRQAIAEADKQQRELSLQKLHDENEHLGLYKDAYGYEHEESVRLQCTHCGTVYADGVPPQVPEKQEPVAWWNDTGTHIDLNVSGRGKPLYTTPQQRTWVDLTDDEMLMIYGQQHEGKKYSLGRMVQQALKEKNT